MPVAAGLSPSATVMNTVPWLGSLAPAAAWALANAVGKSAAIPITSPVERISGPSSESAPAKRLNGSTASLTHTWPSAGVARGRSRSAIALAEHDPAGELGQRQADRLGHERDRPRGTRVGLDHVQPVVAVDRELDVEQPDHAQRPGDAGRLLADPVEHLLAQRVGRQHAGRVAGVDPRLLDVLHDPGDPDVLAVAQGVDVDLDRVLEEAVEVDRGAGLGAPTRSQVVLEARRRCRRSPSRGRRARSWGGPAAGSRPRVRASSASSALTRGGVRRGVVAEPVEQRAEPRAVLGEIDRVDAGAEDRGSRRRRGPAASLSGVWPPNCTTTPSGCSSSQTASTSSSVSGSKYSRSEVS